MTTTTVIRVSQRTLISALDYYRDRLMLAFPARIPSPAAILEMERFLDKVQISQTFKETAAVWHIPVKLLVDKTTCNIDVDVRDPATVELI